MKRKAIYPASFDPVTNGHVDIIERSLQLVDNLVLLVAKSYDKTPLFPIKERIEMLRKLYEGRKEITIDSCEGLLMDYAKRNGINVMVRGLRAISDFEYEFMMATMNKKLNPKVETIFMMTGEAYFYLSSRTVKEVVSLGGSVKGLVPPIIEEELKKRLKRK